MGNFARKESEARAPEETPEKLRRDLIAALPRETRDYCKDLLK